MSAEGVKMLWDDEQIDDAITMIEYEDGDPDDPFEIVAPEAAIRLCRQIRDDLRAQVEQLQAQLGRAGEDAAGVMPADIRETVRGALLNQRADLESRVRQVEPLWINASWYAPTVEDAKARIAAMAKIDAALAWLEGEQNALE